jgi:hypothetical protein
MNCSRLPAANESIRVSDFGTSETADVKQVSSSGPIRTEWQIFVKNLPEDVGKSCVRKWVIFSKEFATCDDSLGLSAICMNGLTREKLERICARLLCCPSIEGHG